jgi:hypothetical protein
MTVSQISTIGLVCASAFSVTSPVCSQRTRRAIGSCSNADGNHSNGTSSAGRGLAMRRTLSEVKPMCTASYGKNAPSMKLVVPKCKPVLRVRTTECRCGVFQGSTMSLKLGNAYVWTTSASSLHARGCYGITQSLLPSKYRLVSERGRLLMEAQQDIEQQLLEGSTQHPVCPSYIYIYIYTHTHT